VLPPTFTITPITGPIARAEPLTVKWDRADGGHEMTIAIDGSCIQTVFARTITGDPGTYTFNAGDIKSAKGSETANCSITVRLSRNLHYTTSSFSAEFGHESHGRASHLRLLVIDTKP